MKVGKKRKEEHIQTGKEKTTIHRQYKHLGQVNTNQNNGEDHTKQL